MHFHILVSFSSLLSTFGLTNCPLKYLPFSSNILTDKHYILTPTNIVVFNILLQSCFCQLCILLLSSILTKLFFQYYCAKFITSNIPLPTSCALADDVMNLSKIFDSSLKEIAEAQKLSDFMNVRWRCCCCNGFCLNQVWFQILSDGIFASA